MESNQLCIQKVTLFNTQGKIDQGTKSSIEHVDQEMIKSGIMLTVKVAETIPIIDNYPVAVTYEIWRDNNLVFEWIISVKIIEGPSKESTGNFRIVGRKVFIDEKLDELINLSEENQ